MVFFIIIAFAAFVVCFVLYCVLLAHFFKKPPMEIDYLYVGMPEEELYEVMGKPKTTLQVDGSSKVVTYVKLHTCYFIWAHFKSIQVALKNGAVVNITWERKRKFE